MKFIGGFYDQIKRWVLFYSSSGPGPGESFGPGQMPSGAMQDMYARGPPSGPLTGMGPRPQYPYGPGYERR